LKIDQKMRIKQNLATGFITLVASGIISQIILLLTWRYLGHLLPRATIGEFALNIFWFEFISVLSLMGVETFYSVYVFDPKFRNYSYNFGRDLVILSIAFSILFFIINGLFKFLHFDISGGYFIILSSVLFVTIFRYRQNVLLVNKELYRYGYNQIARPVIFVLAVVFCYFNDVKAYLYLGYMISFGSIIFINFKYKEVSISSLKKERFLGWSKHSYHFAMVGILGILSSYASRLLTDQIFTITEVGTLTLLLSFSAPVKSTLGVFDKIYYPSAIKNLSQNGKLGLDNRWIWLGFIVMLSFVLLKAIMPFIGAWLLSSSDLSSLKTLAYLFYTYLPMVVWTLFVPVIIHSRPKMYAKVKFCLTILTVVFQAVVFSFISFEDLGLPIYLSECIYFMGLIIFIYKYISFNEKLALILLSSLCLLPIFFA
jgi:O-antigen/teichoic acid export membrane protein